MVAVLQMPAYPVYTEELPTEVVQPGSEKISITMAPPGTQSKQRKRAKREAIWVKARCFEGAAEGITRRMQRGNGDVKERQWREGGARRKERTTKGFEERPGHTGT